MKNKLGIVTLVDIDRVSVVPGGSTGAVRNIQVSGDPSLLKAGDQVMLDYVDGRMLAFPIYQPTPAPEAASAAAEDAVRAHLPFTQVVTEVELWSGPSPVPGGVGSVSVPAARMPLMVR